MTSQFVTHTICKLLLAVSLEFFFTSFFITLWKQLSFSGAVYLIDAEDVVLDGL